MAGLGCSTRLAVSMESLEGGRLSEGGLKMGSLFRDPESCWCFSLDMIEKHRSK